MDKKVTDDFGDRLRPDGHSDFLLNEGLEVLANYRSIDDDDVRAAVRTLIASLARQAAAH